MFQLVCASGLEWLSKAPSQIDPGRSKKLTFDSLTRKGNCLSVTVYVCCIVALWTYFPSDGPNILLLLSLAFKLPHHILCNIQTLSAPAWQVTVKTKCNSSPPFLEFLECVFSVIL